MEAKKEGISVKWKEKSGEGEQTVKKKSEK